MCYSIARTLEMLATPSFAQAGAKTQRQRVVTHAQRKSYSCLSTYNSQLTMQQLNHAGRERTLAAQLYLVVKLRL